MNYDPDGMYIPQSDEAATHDPNHDPDSFENDPHHRYNWDLDFSNDY